MLDFSGESERARSVVATSHQEGQNTGWIRQYSPALRASLSLRPCIISSSSLRTRSASCWSLCSPSCLMRWTNSEGSNSSAADMMMKNTSDPGTTLRRAGETMERSSSKVFKAKQSPLYRHFFGYLILGQASTVSGSRMGGMQSEIPLVLYSSTFAQLTTCIHGSIQFTMITSTDRTSPR